MWVRFTAAFDWVPATKPQVTIAYQAGAMLNVPTPAAQKAIDLGLAVKIKSPTRAAVRARDAAGG